jgi:mediator of RNA polymerase II transcription subunit 17
VTASSDKDKEAEEDPNKKPDFQQPSWPWDSVRNKLRLALTELNVLSDVITVAKDKRYMVLDPVQQEQPEQRQLAQLFAKKRVCKSSSSLYTFVTLKIVFYSFRD